MLGLLNCALGLKVFKKLEVSGCSALPSSAYFKFSPCLTALRRPPYGSTAKTCPNSNMWKSPITGERM